VKHSPLFLLKKDLSHTLSLLKSKQNVSIRVDSPSFVPFVLGCMDFKKTFICEGLFFDDFFSSFGSFPEGVVGFPFVKSFEKGSFVVKSFTQELFERSSVSFSCGPDKISTCIVDERALDRPALYNIKNKNVFVGKGGCEKEDLLSFFRTSGYSLVDSVSSPGEFVIRGGVVDVFSFGLPFPFRVGFFDSVKNVLFFNPSTGAVIKKKDFSFVYPSPQKTKKTIREATSSFHTVKYRDGFLFVSCPKSKHECFCVSKDVVSVFNKKSYKKTSSELVVFSKDLLSEACIINKTKYLPFWFNEKLNSYEREMVPLSGTLSPGDYYVHDAFGVCKYLGFYSSNEDNEKVSLKFADGKMNLDVRFLSKLSFYAPSSSAVSLNYLNKTGAWRKKREKSFRDAQAFVKTLIEASVKRELASSSSLSVDKSFLEEFVGSFPFVDTHDQALAWKRILKDLLSKKPMHRLLCGDVSFGKTELAIRASFLIAANNRSSLVLCPTTILCEQLFQSFKKRLEPFGVRVGQVSRLTSLNKKTTLEYISKDIDVLVGTLSVLKDEEVLKKSSLIVVDEEHRFGVKDKERILNISPGCNYLNMSATPIPRTMQLSLSGIRSISTLLSPPQQRKPIITNIYYFKKSLLASAVSQEMLRDGQVFVVDNSVKNINSLYSFLSFKFPRVSVDRLYASLSKQKIKTIMENFRLGKTRILVSSVIIESGIDIPGANTIIINNANMFGLSQLHQLRGRVGRSGFQSYAYLFVSKKETLTSAGTERLKSIKKHSSLGSGYRLALEDLDIRGAGNLFGYKQSGQSAIGFEHYTKFLAVAMKNKKHALFSETEVSLGRAFIPRSFIPEDEERAFYYKNISESSSLESLSTLLHKTSALFGRLPASFNLLFVSKKIELLAEPTPVVKIIKQKNLFEISLSSKGVENVDSLLKKTSLFFNENKVEHFFSSDILLKIQFKYIKEDYYILLESFIQKINV